MAILIQKYTFVSVIKVHNYTFYIRRAVYNHCSEKRSPLQHYGYNKIHGHLAILTFNRYFII